MTGPARLCELSPAQGESLDPQRNLAPRKNTSAVSSALDTITIVERPKQPDSVEVQVAGEFIGVIFKDEEDGEVSYAFNMAILEMDLPEAPASRT